MVAPTARDGEPPEVGLPLERTVLSWVRTGVGFMIVALLLMRLAVTVGSVVGVAAAFSAFVAALVFVELRRRSRPARARALRDGAGVASPTAVRLAAAFTVLLAAGGLVLMSVGGS